MSRTTLSRNLKVLDKVVLDIHIAATANNVLEGHIFVFAGTKHFSFQKFPETKHMYTLQTEENFIFSFHPLPCKKIIFEN